MFNSSKEKERCVGCALEAMRSTHFSSELLSDDFALAKGFVWVKEALLQLLCLDELPEELTVHTRYIFNDARWWNESWKDKLQNDSHRYFSKWGPTDDPVSQFKLAIEWTEDSMWKIYTFYSNCCEFVFDMSYLKIDLKLNVIIFIDK